MSEFLKEVGKAFHDLRQHHYFSKAQAAYLNELKENIQEDAAIVRLDFAENDSFIVQDARQGHHWDNSQVTLHLFVMYVKSDESNNISVSFFV